MTKPQHTRLLAHHDPKAPISEAFRVLRTNIQFASVDKPLRTLAVTSAGAGSGKSTTVANLGVAMAQSGSKVILIDADMRRPTLHSFFNQRHDTGLSTLLLGRGKLGESLLATGIEDLSLLPSGPIPPNPSEMLSSQAFTHLLEEAVGMADYVLIDTPPVLAVADTSIIAARLDGILLVVKLGEVAKPMAIRAKQQLEAGKAHLLGMVLTNADADNQYGNYYNYYHYGE